VEQPIEYISKYLPAINLIGDRELARKVANVWVKMLQISRWNDIVDLKFKEGYNKSLIDHVNSTTECALQVSRIISKYHGIEFDEDKLIALGLLHDASKAVEYEMDQNGQVVKSRTGLLIQHGVLTAMLAREEGISEELQHMIITHTHDQNMDPAFREGVLFRYVDLCDWDILVKYFKH
jgi:putative nucleotidyltransferase with HDIG domain